MVPPPDDLPTVVRRCIEDAGNLTQVLGIGRVLGQIYAFLYFSPQPHSLVDLEEALGISKGSASMGVRQLEQWNAVRKVWIKGERRDFYEANDWLGEILRNVLRDTVGSRLGQSTALLDELKADLQRDPDNLLDGNRAFVEGRLDNLRNFHLKAQKAWQSPVVRMLLKP